MIEILQDETLDDLNKVNLQLKNQTQKKNQILDLCPLNGDIHF